MYQRHGITGLPFIKHIIKPLYNILEAWNYWFAIYYIYYKEKLEIVKSIHTLFFLPNSSFFGIIEIQNNYILIFAYNNFISIEKKKLD